MPHKSRIAIPNVAMAEPIKSARPFLKTPGKKFGTRFRWIITEETDEVAGKYGIAHVRTSKRLLDRMFSENSDPFLLPALQTQNQHETLAGN